MNILDATYTESRRRGEKKNKVFAESAGNVFLSMLDLSCKIRRKGRYK